MYPRDLDAGGNTTDVIIALVVGLIIGAGLMYWLL